MGASTSSNRMDASINRPKQSATAAWRINCKLDTQLRAGQVGRPKDMHAEMQRVAAILGTELANATKAFDAPEQPDKAIGGGARSSHRQHR